MSAFDKQRFLRLLRFWRAHFEQEAERRLVEHALCEMLGQEHDCGEDCPARPPGWARALRARMDAMAETMRRTGPPPVAGDVFTDAVSGLPPIATPGEVAGALGLHPRTVTKAIELGQLKAIDLGEGGGRGRSSALRIARLSVLDFLRRRAGLPGAPGPARRRPRPTQNT